MSDQTTGWFDLDTICKRAKCLAEELPDRELFVFYDGDHREGYTSRELFTLAGRLANRLRHQGFRHQDVIANTLANSPERVITDLGIIMAGCVSMNGQLLRADGSDFFQSLTTTRCRGVVLDVGENSAAWQLMGKNITVNKLPLFGDICIEQAPEVKTAILIAREKDCQKKSFIEDLRSSDADIFENNGVQSDDLAFVVTTSGSTGYSKLVPRSHREILDLLDFYYRGKWTHPRHNKSKVYSDRQLGWAGGMTVTSFCSGVTRVLCDKIWSTRPLTGADLWRLVVTEGCNNYAMSSQECERIYGHVMRAGGVTYKLDMVEASGQPVMEAQMKKMLTLSRLVLVTYGSSETFLVAMKLVNGQGELYKANNSGHPPTGTAIRVVDDKGENCKPGVTGTIHVKGPFVFRGYFNKLEEADPQTKQALTPDGWCDTNDYGYIDDAGDLYVLGRNNDIITYGQFLVYPSWMEGKLMEHPDITVACLVPVSDPVVYQNVCACLKLVSGSALTEEKIKDYCQSIFLPNVPSSMTPLPGFYLIFRDEFPETANGSGKPDKVKLKKMAEDKFGYRGRSQTETKAEA